jgi:broad specificity phosphatase PhoE
VLPLRRLELRCAGAQGPDLGGDALSTEGVEQAYRLGRSLRIGYTHLFSSGSQRATQTIACILAGMGRHVLNGVVVLPELGSLRVLEWKTAIARAGSTNFQALLRKNEALVQLEATRLSSVLRSLLAQLPEGSYALAVSSDPLPECAFFGLTGKVAPPLENNKCFLITEYKGGRLEVKGIRR